ncbi:GntR family transcriptional regulator [Roseateles sp. GG27B]
MSEKNSSAPTPQYLKVKNHLREGIAAGRWVAGDLLPSEAELVLLFGVSRMTVSRALRELTQDGLIVRLQGVGTFVAQLHRISSTLTCAMCTMKSPNAAISTRPPSTCWSAPPPARRKRQISA